MHLIGQNVIEADSEETGQPPVKSVSASPPRTAIREAANRIAGCRPHMRDRAYIPRLSHVLPPSLSALFAHSPSPPPRLHSISQYCPTQGSPIGYDVDVGNCSPPTERPRGGSSTNAILYVSSHNHIPIAISISVVGPLRPYTTR